MVDGDPKALLLFNLLLNLIAILCGFLSNQHPETVHLAVLYREALYFIDRQIHTEQSTTNRQCHMSPLTSIIRVGW